MGATVERRTALREDGATRAVLRACLPRGESCAREHDGRRQAPGEARRRGGQEEKLELTPASGTGTGIFLPGTSRKNILIPIFTPALLRAASRRARAGRNSGGRCHTSPAECRGRFPSGTTRRCVGAERRPPRRRAGDLQGRSSNAGRILAITGGESHRSADGAVGTAWAIRPESSSDTVSSSNSGETGFFNRASPANSLPLSLNKSSACPVR